MGKGSKNSSKVESKLDKLIETIERNEERASARHKDLTKRINNIESEVNKCKNNDRLMCNEIKKLKASVNALKQGQLANFLNIRGIPEVEETTQDLYDAVMSLFREVSKDITSTHVLKVQRIGKPFEGRVRPVVVELSRKSVKDVLLTSTKENLLDCGLINVKSLDWGTKDQKIYLGHHLTIENTAIFFEARKLRQKGLVKYAWIKDGHILIKKSDDSKAIYLDCLEDVQHFLGKRKSTILHSTRKNVINSDSSSEESGDDSEYSEAFENNAEQNDDERDKRSNKKRVATSPVINEQPLSQRPKRITSQKQH